MIRGFFWRVGMPFVIGVGVLLMIGGWFFDLTQREGTERKRRLRERKWKK